MGVSLDMTWVSVTLDPRQYALTQTERPPQSV